MKTVTLKKGNSRKGIKRKVCDALRKKENRKGESERKN
jgi:hypothetical protein